MGLSVDALPEICGVRREGERTSLPHPDLAHRWPFRDVELRDGALEES